MNEEANVTVKGSWTQTGGQDPYMPVDYLSATWWWAQRDRRSDSYPLLNDPALMVLISVVYVIFVTLVGPWLMRDRKPFDLKNTLLAYNLFQVILSLYMVIEAWDAGWGRHLSWSKYIYTNKTKILFVCITLVEDKKCSFILHFSLSKRWSGNRARIPSNENDCRHLCVHDKQIHWTTRYNFYGFQKEEQSGKSLLW